MAAVATAILAVAGALSAPPPAAAAPAHVGVVVRFADGGVGKGCTSSGGNGLEVLERLHDVTLGSGPYAGFVLQIDNRGTTHPDNTHYWSYWHWGGRGGWTYSGSGAGSYTPKPGSVEGWSYVDGGNDAPPPPSTTYAALCGRLDPAPSSSTGSSSTRPSSTPSSRPSSTRATAAAPGPARTRPTPATRPATRTAPRPRPAPVRTTLPTRPSHSAPSHRTLTAGTSTHPAPHSSRPSSAIASTESSTSTPSTSAPSTTAAPAADRRDSSSGIPAWGTLLALLVIAALGALAWVLARRRRV